MIGQIMVKIPGYDIETQIYAHSKTVVYRGRRQKDKKPIIIKSLRTDYPSLKDIAQITQEYQIARSLDIDGVVKAETLVTYGNGIALILEDFGGTSLAEVMTGAKLELSSFLHLGIQLAEALGHLHINNIIHNDIKPENLIVNIEKKVIKITDFGIAIYLSKEKGH